jgi:hypothetical protein
MDCKRVGFCPFRGPDASLTPGGIVTQGEASTESVRAARGDVTRPATILNKH